MAGIIKALLGFLLKKYLGYDYDKVISVDALAAFINDNMTAALFFFGSLTALFCVWA